MKSFLDFKHKIKLCLIFFHVLTDEYRTQKHRYPKMSTWFRNPYHYIHSKQLLYSISSRSHPNLPIPIFFICYDYLNYGILFKCILGCRIMFTTNISYFSLFASCDIPYINLSIGVNVVSNGSASLF